MTALERARSKRGWTKHGFARAMGINPGSYHRIEAGIRGIQPAIADAMCDLLKVPVKDVFGSRIVVAKEEQ